MEQYLTVSQLTEYISRKFNYDPYLENVYLKGEISNYNPRRQGANQYFNIKDEDTIISAVLFKRSAQNVKFIPEDGMSVLVQGRVQVYKGHGKYQIVIHSMEPDGLGALFLAYEQTKEKLAKEGLFADHLKKPIPKYPKKIGVLTSESGAVIQDIITTIKRRFPITQIVLYPTVVQGKESADSIVNNIEKADARDDIDIIIMGRGGGSFEDLFSFNEEKVVRAVSKAKTPIISSVGHQTDNTLTDFVADLRAPTPTAAAEMAVPVLSEELLKLNEYNQRLIRAFKAHTQYHESRLTKILSSIIFRNPERLYDGYVQNVDQLEEKLIQNVTQSLNNRQQELRLKEQQLRSYPFKQRLNQEQSKVDFSQKNLTRAFLNLIQRKENQVNQSVQALEHLSPLKILARGYAVVEKDDKVIHSVSEIQKNDALELRLTDGVVEVTANNITQNKELEND